METINTFQGGMNKDISKSLYKEGSYIHAENFSLVTDLGLSTGSLRNINGNENFITIPNCSNVVSITDVTGSVALNINGNSFAYTVSTTEQLGAAMKADTLLTNNGYGVAYTDTQVVLYSLLFNNNLVINSINVTGTNCTINNNAVPAVTNPKIMGWGTIRDEIILYTAENSLETPVNELGQIWKLTYDKYSSNPILTLLYNNYLNFSLAHPIPNPGGFVGNFETPNIKKIYWTDNYNRPRTLNIADVNAMALTIQQLEITPDVLRPVATVDEILSGGNINTGIYQVSARLTKTTGTTAGFATPSNPVPVYLVDDHIAQEFYQTSDTNVPCPKSIRGKIYNLDTTYDRIEPVILYKENGAATPDIFILPSQPIPSTGIFEFIYSGNETTIPISLEEFLSQNIDFLTVKTMVSKYNMLFFGNVKYSDFDVNFDARAYRFNNSGTAELKDGAGNIAYTFTNPATSIPENADAIQDAAMQESNSRDNFLFQSDGITFGGEGPNVKYRFVPINTVEDNTNYNPFRVVLDSANISSGTSTWPKVFTRVDDNNAIVYDLDSNPSTQYNNVNHPASYANYSSPYAQYGIKGYMRDETYRFGIVFFSKKGEPSYAHWIADIRMPKPWMPSVTSANPVNRDYLAFSHVSKDSVLNNFFGHALGIEFTVDISSIKDQISGYSIVRVNRDENNKTILGQGILHPVFHDNTGGYVSSVAYGNSVPNAYDWANNPSDTPTSATWQAHLATLSCPDFLFNTSPSFATNDQIDVVSEVSESRQFYVQDLSTFTAIPRTAVDILLTVNEGTGAITAWGPRSTANPITIHGTQEMKSPFDTGGLNEYSIQSIPALMGVRNYAYQASGVPDIYSYANRRLLVGCDPVINRGFADLYPNPTPSPDPNDDWGALLFQDGIIKPSYINQILANYRRPLANQYGGNTFSERSFNEYISTGHIELVDSNSPNTNTCMVFGGDTVVSVFDYANQFKNYQITYADGYFKGMLVPLECSFPIELRENPNRTVLNKSEFYGAFPQRITGNTAAPDVTIEVTEDFIYNDDYNAVNDIVKFFPKPDPYIFQDIFDVRIHRSQIKANGELTDSWGVFKPEDHIDLDTIQGPINNLVIHQDRVVSFQDKGVALVSINERSLTQDVSGSEIILGTGGVLSRYDYISKIIGSRHQFSFVTSHDAVFWFDMNTKNMYKMQGNSPSAITVAKGLSSFMSNNLGGLIQVNDNPYLNKGITSTYDFRYNEAIMTFRDSVVDTSKSATAKGVTFTAPTTYDFNINPSPIWMSPGTNVLVTVKETGEAYPGVIISGGIITIPEAPAIDTNYTITIYPYTRNSFTVAYNDIIDAYTSFYSYTPPVYINDQVSIFSPAEDYKTIYRHDVGDHGVFYDAAPAASKLKLIVNQFASETKVFDNYEIVSESIDLSNGANIATDFFDRIRLYNDYQNTDFQNLPIDNGKQTAKRKERTWNISNLRNRVLYTTSSPNIFDPAELAEKPFGERMRDKYLLVDLEYDNLQNYRFIMHTFKSHFRKSAR